MADGQRRNRGRSDGGRPSKGPGGDGSRRQSPSGGRGGSPKGRQGPDRKARTTGSAPSREDRKKLHAGGQLPRWIREEITRSTPKERRDAAIRELENGVEAFAAERYKPAAAALRKAKAAASSSATIRELLGLSAYHIGNWDEALKELRAFRRMSGETDQMPIEMDCLRALGRGKDVGKTYDLFHELGGGRDTDNEARVVYASHLVDEGRLDEAWKVVNARLVANPPESLVRRWAVSARVAHAAGDDAAASKFLAAIRDHDAELPWLEDLESELAG